LAPGIETGGSAGKAKRKKETEQREHGCFDGSDALMRHVFRTPAPQAIANFQADHYPRKRADRQRNSQQCCIHE
jgi:hypothetical protein